MPWHKYTVLTFRLSNAVVDFNKINYTTTVASVSAF